MTLSEDMPDRAVLVAIDVAKHVELPAIMRAVLDEVVWSSPGFVDG